MDSGDGGQSSGSKRKSPSDAKEDKKENIPFRVFLHNVGFNQRSQKLSKPDVPAWDRFLVLKKDYPDVCTRMVNAQNKHALNIMHSCNHKNILCMSALGRDKSQIDDEVSGFFPETNGNLYKEPPFTALVNHGLIPSITFQDITKEIIDGADYLWRNRKYHGKLSWDTTYFEHPYTVKLYGFTPKDQISLEEAQWQDWDDIVLMLEVVVAKANAHNAKPNNPKVVFDELEALITTMKASARLNASPLSMRAIINEEVFFWNPRNRAKFCMITIHKLFNNVSFQQAVEPSSICPEEWYCRTKTEGLTYYESLVKYCNDYRQNLERPLPIFNENLKMDFLHFLHAAYTHRSQIMNDELLNVDDIIQRMFPRLFVELNRIVKRFVN